MAILQSDIWRGLKRKLQNIALGITGNFISIIDIPRVEGEIGYTAGNNSIHLAYDHPLMDDLSREHKVSFITGVFAHELMHKLATEFAYETQKRKGMPELEAEIFHLLCNVIEDPAIEEQAKYYIGGHILNCLHYMVMTLYKKGPPIDPSEGPFDQFISALIMYGDGGVLKGEFSSKKARKTFHRVLPVVDKAIEERDGTKRIDYAYTVFKMSENLWRSEIKDRERRKEFLENLRKRLSEMGKDIKSEGGRAMGGKPDDEASDPKGELKKRRRKITYRKVSKEEMEELRKNGSSGTDDGESNIEVLYCEEDLASEGEKKSGLTNAPDGIKEKGHGEKKPEGGSEAAGKPSGEESKDDEDVGKNPECGSGGTEVPESGKEETAEDGAKASEKTTGEDEEASEEAGEDDKSAKTAPSDDEDKRPESDEGSCTESRTPDFEKEAVIEDEEYELSDEDFARIASLITEIKEQAAVEKAEKDACYAESLDIPSVAANYSGVRCINKRVTSSSNQYLEDKYSELVLSMSDGINFLYNQMKRIINNDAADREYKGTGRLNIPRLNSGRMTTRVFERNIEPANKADMCVEILVDESGSMRGNKEYCAMTCVVALAEVFAKLHIPTKVIGFTSDETSKYDVTHYHYMHWLNTKAERMNLLSITARANNFDGYSIRYASEMLNKRKERHKMLIILSDGKPACHYYTGYTGIADTTNAIKQAAKKQDIIGVGIGGTDTSVWKAMYGNAFIHVKDAKDLLNNI